MRVVSQVAPFLSYTLTLSTFILGTICIAFPTESINFIIPFIGNENENGNENDNGNENGDDDNDVTAMEQILIRLFGGVLIAYAINCYTFLYFGNKTITDTSTSTSTTTDTSADTGNGTDSIHDFYQDLNKDQKYHRVTLGSSMYLGLSILLVVIFEMVSINSSTSTSTSTSTSADATFMDVIAIAAAFIILGLLGIIASFFPEAGSTGVNHSVNINNNNNVIDNDNEDTNSTPLLANDHLQENDPENQTEVFEDEPQPEQEQDDEENKFSGGRITGTRRLIKMAGPQSFYLFIGCLVLLVRLPCSLSIPHFVSVTLGAVARGEYETAKLNILLLFIFGTIDAALDFFCIFLFGLANLKISRGIRIELFTAILKQEMGFFDSNKSGDLASRLNSDCGAMASDLTWFFRFSIESVVRISGIVLYMFIRNPKLASCAVSAVPIVAMVNKKYGDWLGKNATNVQTALAEANSVAQEALLCIRTVIAFASEKIEQKKYRAKIDEYYGLNVKQLYATGFYYMMISTFLINTCIQALLLYVGMLLIRSGQMHADVLLAFMLYQSQLQSEVMNLFNSYTSLVKSSGAGDKVFQLLDRSIPAPGIGSSELLAIEGGSPDTVELGDINVRDLHFAYPARPDEIVLRNLNLNVPAGKTVALIGKSGCGKSTIFSLLQRFYDPSSGDISISGTNLKDLNVLNYRKSIGTVTQDPMLFSGTIMSNIAYCAPDSTSMEQVIEAAKLANAHSFIESFEDGYNTEVGERGVQLSGGQKQRVAIARAIISKPKLLLLDEATSALDSESERLVQDALDRLLSTSREMTTVVIAHRLQTIRNADKIVVMQDGQVVEEGTHDVLIQADGGLYQNMVNQADINN